MKLTVANKNYGLVEFYDEVATQLGYDKDKVEYDCTKICVAANIQDNFFAHYREENPELSESDLNTGVGMMLVCSGPKVDKNLKDNEVEVFVGFIINKEVE